MPEKLKENDGAAAVESSKQETTNEESTELVEQSISYDPILPLMEIPTNEEDEVEMINLRAKLYRFESSTDPSEWKERGTGNIKLLRHKTKNSVRVVMRRDKTLKICANHFITPWMELKPSYSSDRAFVWSVLADFADEQLKQELLAIRFANADIAKEWKETFEKAKNIVSTQCEIYAGKTYADLEGESTNDEEESESESEIESSENLDKPQDSKSTDEVTEKLASLEVNKEDETK